ncbi:prephenate dehydrogenase [Actinoplanes sp. RD1]|uniref:prephenate dehydrogenase n=1 Tax=Actinoplanes sp. RD1 TaxID=3064538 RepID=UPI002740FABD|nr:prephenate dehydrogenase/arogenate dehydrogenase family protein [Actinoplanes sp. RD1]
MNVSVLGLGLIGGSLLRALAARGHHVTGYDSDAGTRAAVSAAGLTVTDDIPSALAGASLAILAVPLPALAGVGAELAAFSGLVTDVTSVKVPVRTALAGRRFVGGHPMAGKESSGFLASDPHLFDGCAWVLCLEPETDLGDWLTLAALITSLGARVVPATAAEHDQAVARISHVPHLLATALSGLLDGQAQAATLAAGSFRDGTRVAATRAALIAAMCGGNAGPTAENLSTVIASLSAYRDALTADDPIAALTPLLDRPGQLRRQWPPAAYSPVEVARDPAALLELGRAGGWLTEIGAVLVGKRPEADRIGS